MSKEVLDAVAEVKDSVRNLKTEYQDTIDQKVKGLITEEEYKTRMDAMDKRFDLLEAKAAQAQESPEEKEIEAKEQFAKDIRAVAGGKQPEMEKKGLYTDADVQGGYLVRPSYANSIMEKAVEISPVDQFAQVVSLSQGNSFEYPVENGVMSVDETTERGTRSETTASTFDYKTINVYEEYAEVWLSQQMIEDSAFDIVSFVNRKAAEQFAKSRGNKLTVGTGVNQATGFTQASGTSSIVNGSATTIDADKLIAMVDDIKTPYADSGKWMFHRKTRAHIRKLRSDSGAGAGTGNYLWDPMSLQNNAPARLLGYEYGLAIDLDSPDSSDEFTSGDKPVWFADWNRFYVVANKVGLSLLRDPYTKNGTVKMKFRIRFGGLPILEEAATYLSMTT